MSRFDGEPVEVSIGECQCGTPHGGPDVVYLYPRLTYEGGWAGGRVVMQYLGQEGMSEVFAMELSKSYLRHQVVGRNLMNGVGPLTYDPDLLMRDWKAAKVVADAADELYSEALLAPLVAAVSTSSQGGRTAGSTSRRTRRSSGRPKP